MVAPDIEEFLQQRKICYLYHFTRVENLANILKNGLQPRSLLNGSADCFNDSLRLDRCKNAVCMTIGFPNYKMFYKYRSECPDAEWAVLRLNAQILADCDCAFCPVNAGSTVSCSIPLQQRKGVAALEKLYAPVVAGVERAPFIPSSYPTSPQAEVLVFCVVSPVYIMDIIFNRAETMQRFQNAAPSVPHMAVNADWFFPRMDYKQWQNEVSSEVTENGSETGILGGGSTAVLS